MVVALVAVLAVSDVRSEPPDPLLAALVEQALAARPELARAQALVQAERERVPQVGALPDPMVEIGVQNDGFSSWEIGNAETSWYSILATQRFPWPGQRGLAREVAELDVQGSEAAIPRVLLATEAEVRRSYLELVLARDRLELVDRLQALWEKSAVLARTRYEIGQGAQSDVLRAQLELNRLTQRRWALEVDAETALASLNRLRGEALDAPIETTVHLPEMPLPALPDPEAAAQDALARSPELAAARLEVQRAESAARLARRSDRPELTVNAGVMPRGGEFPTMWTASVGSTIPIFTRNKQSRAAAESEARRAASGSGVEALEQLLRLRAAQRRVALAAALETIRLYRDGLLVQSQATSDSTLAQYEVGKVTFASVLEANAGFIADQEGYLQALALALGLEIDALELSPEGEAS